MSTADANVRKHEDSRNSEARVRRWHEERTLESNHHVIQPGCLQSWINAALSRTLSESVRSRVLLGRRRSVVSERLEAAYRLCDLYQERLDLDSVDT